MYMCLLTVGVVHWEIFIRIWILSSLFPLFPLINQAIKFLLEKELLNNTPEDVALYLFQNGMDKVALGDYLGEG